METFKTALLAPRLEYVGRAKKTSHWSFIFQRLHLFIFTMEKYIVILHKKKALTRAVIDLFSKY